MADPWRWWLPDTIARASDCPVAAVREHWPLIADALERRGIYDRDVCLGVIATVAIETASTFEPVTEAFWLDDAWRHANLRYAPFWGRGYVQLTWENGYRNAGAALGLDLVGHPDLALDPAVAADVLAWFWATSGVPAKDGSRYWSLPDLCRDHDWPWVRKVVQGGHDGLDRLIDIATTLDAVKEAPMARVTFNPQEPAHLQEDSFDCSQEALEWALYAMGRQPQENWLEPTMIAEGVMTPEWGLMDASGAGLAAFIRRHYGEFGYDAVSNGSVGFDDVRSVAGTTAVMIGGRRWGDAGHWSGVRGYDAATDRLLLANPASGPTYGQTTLSRQDFAARAPFSMVLITHPDLAAPPAPPIDETEALRARVAQLEAEKAGLISTIGYLTGDVASALQAAVDTLKRHAPAA